MDPIKATLRSKTDPALGSVTIQFPIHRKEYDRVLEQLKPLDIGSPLDQDCQIEMLDSHYPILKRLEETLVNLGQLIAVEDKLGEDTASKYDADGRLIQETNELGHLVKYRYDAMGRVTKKVNEDGTSQEYTYDENGKPVR